MKNSKILIVDDEERIVRLVSDFLKASGYTAVSAATGSEALRICESETPPQLAVIDIMIPEPNGWELTRRIRAFSDMPIIILSARSEEFDMLSAFEAGADEYVVKPFSPAVLVKRIEALLRRRLNSESSGRISLGDLIIDKSAHTAAINSVPLNLTLKEFELLCYFADHPDQVISRDELLHSVWGYEYIGDARTVDSHMARLRLKLGDYGNSHIRTVYRMGYRFES